MATLTVPAAPSVPVSVRHVAPPGVWPLPADLDTDLARARWLATWLDTKFSFMGFRFGLEGLLGLIPFVGDLLGALAGMFPFYVASRHRLGKAVQARMGLNLLIEFLVGLIPWVGDAFDVGFKANVRNVRLLEKAAAKARTAGTTSTAHTR